MGTWDHSPLSQDTIPTSWHTDWPTRWSRNNREAIKGQAKAYHLWICREPCKRVEGRKVHRMLSSDTKGIEKGLWRGTSSCIRAIRALQEEEVPHLVKYLITNTVVIVRQNKLCYVTSYGLYILYKLCLFLLSITSNTCVNLYARARRVPHVGYWHGSARWPWRAISRTLLCQ